MTKIFKRISAVAMAAAMATTMAITASAESTVKSGTLKGHTTEAILSAYETYVDGVRMPWDFTAATVYGGDGTAYASLDVDDYYTGELLDRSERRGADTIGNVSIMFRIDDMVISKPYLYTSAISGGISICEQINVVSLSAKCFITFSPPLIPV